MIALRPFSFLLKDGGRNEFLRQSTSERLSSDWEVPRQGSFVIRYRLHSHACAHQSLPASNSIAWKLGSQIQQSRLCSCQASHMTWLHERQLACCRITSTFERGSFGMARSKCKGTHALYAGQSVQHHLTVSFCTHLLSNVLTEE